MKLAWCGTQALISCTPRYLTSCEASGSGAQPSFDLIVEILVQKGTFEEHFDVILFHFTKES